METAHSTPSNKLEPFIQSTTPSPTFQLTQTSNQASRLSHDSCLYHLLHPTTICDPCPYHPARVIMAPKLPYLHQSMSHTYIHSTRCHDMNSLPLFSFDPLLKDVLAPPQRGFVCHLRAAVRNFTNPNMQVPLLSKPISMAKLAMVYGAILPALGAARLPSLP